MVFSRLASIFLSSIPRIILTVVLVIGVIVGGGFLLGVFGVPSVENVDNRFGDVNRSTTIIETDLSITNPNPIGVSLGGVLVSYGVTMNDVVMAVGEKKGVAVDVRTSTLALTTRMLNERIPEWWVSHVGNGERTELSVNASVTSSLLGRTVGIPPIERTINTNIASSFNSTETQPIEADQPFVSDPVLYLNETSGSWGEVTDAETPVEMTFTLYNPKSYPIPLGEIGYDITMNDVDVGSGETSREVAIPPKSTTTVSATTVIDNEKLDEWWVSHLQRNQVTDLEIVFSARLDLSGTGGGSIEVPLDSVTHRFETDIFGTKNQTDVPETNGSMSPDSTQTDSGETGTEESTPTPTPEGQTGTQSGNTETQESETGTATSTPTDDGLL